MKHGCDEPDKELGASYLFLGDQPSWLPFEPFRIMGKTSKSSVPVLSEGPLYFLLSTLLAALGFSHIWPIALEFCSAHATRCMADRGVVFRVAQPNSSRFSIRASRQNTRVLNVPVWLRFMSVEAVGFELSE